MSITIPTGDLVGVLSDVIPFAFPDDILPELNCVRLEWDGETLHALTTDRYRVGWSQWTPGDIDADEAAQDDLFTEWGSGDEPWSTSIALADAKELVKVFKLPPKEANTPILVDHNRASERTKVIRTRETGHSAITVVADGLGLTFPFPDVRAQLAKADRVKAARNVLYKADYLADFAKVRPRGPMQLTFTATITHVTIGKRFVGAIMPQRDDEPTRSLLRDGVGVVTTATITADHRDDD